MSDAVQAEPTVLPETPETDRRIGAIKSLARAVLIVATLLTFCPAFRYDFINLDDRHSIAQNPLLNPPTWNSLKVWWKEPQFDMYLPVMSTVQGGIALLAHVSPDPETGDALNPWVFHAVNILLHVGSTLLVFQILLHLEIRPWPACAGALLFAIHPVQVEPVVWITSIKDVLYGSFGLLALWRLLIALGSPLETGEPISHLNSVLANYIFATVCFVLAILSKPTAVILPLVALPLIWMQWGTISRRAWLAVLIWMVLAIPFCVIAKHVQPAHLKLILPMWQRLLVAGDALAFYLFKLIWPKTLVVYYGRNPGYILHHGFIWWTWIIPAALIALLWLNRQRCAPLLAGIGIFVAGLLPVLGFVGFNFQYYSTVADRYLYLSMLGIALMVAWTLDRLPRAFGIVAAVVLVILATRSAVQLPYWKDSLTLLGHALDNAPDSAVANANVAGELVYERNYQGAIEFARKSIALDPDRAEPYVTLAKALDRIGATDEAVQTFRDGFHADPGTEELFRGYLVALIHEGDLRRAIVFARLAVELQPDAASYVELGATLAKMNDWSGARHELEKAVSLDPKDYDAQCILGSVLYHLGDRAGAIAHYEAAESVDPDRPAAHTALQRIGASRQR
jgi:tetratricopeptide (TPR) repeat protein